jgi:hypothetical protein
VRGTPCEWSVIVLLVLQKILPFLDSSKDRIVDSIPGEDLISVWLYFCVFSPFVARNPPHEGICV